MGYWRLARILMMILAANTLGFMSLWRMESHPYICAGSMFFNILLMFGVIGCASRAAWIRGREWLRADEAKKESQR